MRPFSKVIQLISRGDGRVFIALCEDGSIWDFDDSDGSFILIQEMEDGRYLVPARSEKKEDEE